MIDPLITFHVHLSTLIGVAILSGITLGVVVSIMFSHRRELHNLINEKL